MTQKPGSIKWMQGLLTLKIFLLLSLFIASLYCLYTKPSEGFWGGFSDAVLKNLNKENEAYAAGQLTGAFVLNLILAILQLIFLQRKKQTPFWIAFGIESLYGITSGNLPLINIPIFILGLVKPSKEYFSKKGGI